MGVSLGSHARQGMTVGLTLGHRQQAENLCGSRNCAFSEYCRVSRKSASVSIFGGLVSIWVSLAIAFFAAKLWICSDILEEMVIIGKTKFYVKQNF